MEDNDRRLLALVQDGIPLARKPFREVGESLDMSEREVLGSLQRLIDDGTIRRFGARIDHRRLGIVANAMICWKVPEEEVTRAGRIASGHRRVTHCYERKVIPGVWEYNFFCVIHGQSVEDVVQEVRSIEEAAGISGHLILFSERKFKHTPAATIPREEP
jgi:DNA-binding Lrp family transcriptional regulator